MRRTAVRIGLSVLAAGSVAVWLAACSSDEESGGDGAGATGGSGGSGAVGSGGTGGGAGGSGGTGGSGVAPIDCQGTTCEGLTTPISLAPCCAGAGDRCGIQVPMGPGCQPLDEPGVPDESCTEAFRSRLDAGAGPGDGGAGEGGSGEGGPGTGDGGPAIQGCCRPDGTCGIELPLLGCTDVSTFVDSGAPQTCTP
jgi:hypothetical protein